MTEMKEKKRVLFICTHNSARSQMAEGLMNALHGDCYEAYSAGTEPSGVNPHAVTVMAEAGMDISGHESKSVDQFIGQEFEYVVTVCDHANETCPFFPGGKERIHKGFEDPAAVQGDEEAKLAAFKRIREEIKEWINDFFQS